MAEKGDLKNTTLNSMAQQMSQSSKSDSMEKTEEVVEKVVEDNPEGISAPTGHSEEQTEEPITVFVDQIEEQVGHGITACIDPAASSQQYSEHCYCGEDGSKKPEDSEDVGGQIINVDELDFLQHTSGEGSGDIPKTYEISDHVVSHRKLFEFEDGHISKEDVREEELSYEEMRESYGTLRRMNDGMNAEQGQIRIVNIDRLQERDESIELMDEIVFEINESEVDFREIVVDGRISNLYLREMKVGAQNFGQYQLVMSSEQDLLGFEQTSDQTEREFIGFEENSEQDLTVVTGIEHSSQQVMRKVEIFEQNNEQDFEQNYELDIRGTEDSLSCSVTDLSAGQQMEVQDTREEVCDSNEGLSDGEDISEFEDDENNELDEVVREIVRGEKSGKKNIISHKRDKAVNKDKKESEIQKGKVDQNECEIKKEKVEQNECQIQKGKVEQNECKIQKGQVDQNECKIQKGKVQQNECKIQKGRVEQNEYKIQKGKLEQNECKIQKGRVEQNECKIQKGKVEQNDYKIQKGKMEQNECKIQKGKVEQSECKIQKGRVEQNDYKIQKGRVEQNEYKIQKGKVDLKVVGDNVADSSSSQQDFKCDSEESRTEMFARALDFEKEGDQITALKCYLGCLSNLEPDSNFLLLPQCLRNVADIYYQREEYDKAICFIQAEKLFYENALIDTTEIQQKIAGEQNELSEGGGDSPVPRDVLRADEYEHLARVCMDRRQPQLALEYSGKATKIRQKVYGDDHRITKESLDYFAALYAEVGRHQYSESVKDLFKSAECSPVDQDSSEMSLPDETNIRSPSSILRNRKAKEDKEKKQVRFEEPLEYSRYKEECISRGLLCMLFAICFLLLFVLGSWLYCNLYSNTFCESMQNQVQFYLNRIKYFYYHYDSTNKVKYW